MEAIKPTVKHALYRGPSLALVICTGVGRRVLRYRSLDGGMEGKSIRVEPEIIVTHQQGRLQIWGAGQSAPHGLPAVYSTAEVINVLDVPSTQMTAHAIARIRVQYIVDVGK